MHIGDTVIHDGRELVLVGHEPMGLPDRLAHVEDPLSGERFEVPYDELEPARQPPRGFDTTP